MDYNLIINESGVTINNIPSGKYEIVESNDNQESVIKSLSEIENVEIEVTDSNNVMKYSTKNDFVKEFGSIPSVNYEVKYSILNHYIISIINNLILI